MEDLIQFPLIVKLPESIVLSDEQIFDLCSSNDLWSIQIDTQTGELLMNPPSGWETSNRNFDLAGELYVWNRQSGLGQCSDSSGGFLIAGASKMPIAPDAAWVSNVRLATVPRDRREKFLPLCPDFVVELRSPSDSVPSLQRKLEEWIRLGVRLAWGIDRQNRRVSVYRPGVRMQTLEEPVNVAADPELPGFVLQMSGIW